MYSSFQPQQQLRLALLVQQPLAQIRIRLYRLYTVWRTCSATVSTSDWVSNADKVWVIYWQMIGDKKSAANWLRQTLNRNLPTTTLCRASSEHGSRADPAGQSLNRLEIVLGVSKPGKRAACG